MIPKVIHYCWFGGNLQSRLNLACKQSWWKMCPGYKIIEWNETNYDIKKTPLYVRQAWEAKKWAFVTDYARLQIIYENGGIYLDTDVELLKSLDDLLGYTAFFGLQNDLYVATGLGFGAEKGCELLLALMRDYQDITFLRPDGSMDLTPCPKRNDGVFMQRGLRRDNTEQSLDGGIHIFPVEFFCPKNFVSKELMLTENTYSIHHFSESWHSQAKKLEDMQRNKFINEYGYAEGQKKMERWKRRHRLSLAVKRNGWKGMVKKLIGKC